VLHVRLVGSLEARVRRLAENRGMPRKSALDFIQQHDLGRRRFVKKYFGEDVANPQLYHLVINTDLIPTEAVAELLAQFVLKGFDAGTAGHN
jgi:cytidylate kinase